MSVRVRGMLVAIVSVVLVIVSTMAVAERQSPGPVAVVHARLPELAGGDACSSCHGGWFGDMQAACLECHGDIAAQMEEDRGLHGIQPDARVRACATCHSDHHGGEFRMVNRLAFSQAGVADPQNFDHRIIGFELGGAHTELVCSECHEHADAEVLPAGAKRFLGLSRDCASCHDDPHEGRMQLACDACHSQDVFTSRAVPNHDRWLQLVGPHAQAECRTCHAGDTEHALERLQSGMQAGRACGDCHESPHTEQFAAGNARASGLPPVAGCVVCHPVVDERFEQPSFRINPTHHAHTGFALTAPHHQVACDDCHPSGLTFAERHPGRESDDCGACHTDPHDGQFDAAPLAKDGCISCHARTQFAPHAFDAEMHARTRLPLAGRHAELPCSDCHRIEEEGRARTFHGTPNRCESCHADAHEDTFAVRAAPANAARLAAEPRGKCATCHVATAWRDLDHERFDHTGWTGFGLDGAHGQIECTDCHARTEAPDGFGRRFGRIPEQEGAGAGGPGACDRCHGDPHEGIFSGPAVPRDVDGRMGCRRCHDTASFRSLPYGFEHGDFAGFELSGKHAQLDCVACHESLETVTRSGRTWGRARGTACADCHADPHRGQFVRFGKIDCQRCHRSQTSFATVSFRHNLDSRFHLGEQHKKVACGLCHKPESKDGVTFVRYKPLPTRCVDCHGREEGGVNLRRRRR